MPKEGYYSLTINEQTAKHLKVLAERENLGLVEYFEKAAGTLEQIRIGKLLELSAVKTLFCQELYRPLEEVQLIMQKLLEREETIDRKKRTDSLGHFVETLLRYTRKAHLINLYTMDAIHSLDPSIKVPSTTDEARKTIEREMKVIPSERLVDQSMIKILDRLKEFFSAYEKLITKYGKDEEPIKTFIDIVDSSVADLKKDVLGKPEEEKRKTITSSKIMSGVCPTCGFLNTAYGCDPANNFCMKRKLDQALYEADQGKKEEEEERQKVRNS